MDQALAMYRKGVTTGVNSFNHRLVKDHARGMSQFPTADRQILFDPQTSGGLLASIPASQGAKLIQALEGAKSPAAAIIGRVETFKVRLTFYLNEPCLNTPGNTALKAHPLGHPSTPTKGALGVPIW